MKIQLLSDNRIIGTTICEIVSFPTPRESNNGMQEALLRNYQEFERLLGEFYKLGVDTSTMIECIWITEPVEKQAFKSKIHVYFVIRKIGKDKKIVSSTLTYIEESVYQSLLARQYNVRKNIEQEGLFEFIHGLDKRSILSITKSEHCNYNINSIYPYYYADVVPLKNTENFKTVVTAMSQMKDCAISFQLFPVQFSSREIYYINELTAQLSRLSSGIMLHHQMYRDVSAVEPGKVMNYYNQQRGAANFLYNFIIFGERQNCLNLSAKCMSLLQAGKEEVCSAKFQCIDISSEGLSVEREFAIYPWNILNLLMTKYRNRNLLAGFALARELQRMPYIMTAGEAAAFFRLPLFEQGMTAIQSNQAAESLEQFDRAVVSESNILFGQLLANDGQSLVIGAPGNAFTKHALIVGTPGSGKTTFSIHLLLQFAKKGIPFLAIEPTKTEYRAMIDAVPNLQIFTPGNNRVSPFIVNPFIPPKGISIEQYIPSLSSAFNAAFSMPAPLDMVFLKAIRTCYTEYGWKDYSTIDDPDVHLFGMYEFILTFKKIIGGMNYGREVKGNIESGGLLRLTNLLEQNSNIYDTIHTISIEDLLSKPTVLELNAIENAEQKSLIMALLLINICVYTKHNVLGDGKLKNIMLIDEAHVLLSGSISQTDGAEAKESTVRALQNMIAEIRSYGTGIIIADQTPSKVSREIVANTDIKIMFRLVEADERRLIADSTNMNDSAMQKLSGLKVGEAYVFYNKLESPQIIKTKDIREQEGIRLSVTDQEINRRMTYWNTHRQLLKPFVECDYCELCTNVCDFDVRSNADYYANRIFSLYRKAIKDNGTFARVIMMVPEIIAGIKEDKTDCQEKKRLIFCTRLRLIRKVQLEMNVRLHPKDIKKLLLCEVKE